MKRIYLKDILVFTLSFVLYYVFGTGLIYLILKAVYNSNSSLFPVYISNSEFTDRGLSNIAQFISSIIILVVLFIIYFKNLKGHFVFFKDIKLVIKTIGYGLFIYFVTICYNLFLPFVGGSGADGSNVNMIKISMEYQYWIMFVMVVVLGPIIEELLFRFIPFKALKEKISRNKLLLISSILFTIPHIISLVTGGDVLGDLLSLPKYLIIGWMLGSYYYKNNDIGRVILIHIVYNVIAFLLMTMSLALM